jgi:hypothetical protein
VRKGCAKAAGRVEENNVRAKRMNAFETIAARMPAREGLGVIWELHVRAAASYRRGNWLSAVTLAGTRIPRNGYGASGDSKKQRVSRSGFGP